MALNNFNEIEHFPLRVFNRVAFLYNLVEDGGKYAGEEYLEQFDKEERKQMYVMAAYIKRRGIEATRKEVTKGLVLQE